VTSPYLLISGTYPIFVSLFVYCLDWRCIVFLLVMIVVTTLIWYPFFKVYDNSLLKNEQAMIAQEPETVHPEKEEELEYAAR